MSCNFINKMCKYMFLKISKNWSVEFNENLLDVYFKLIN